MTEPSDPNQDITEAKASVVSLRDVLDDLDDGDLASLDQLDTLLDELAARRSSDLPVVFERRVIDAPIQRDGAVSAAVLAVLAEHSSGIDNAFTLHDAPEDDADIADAIELALSENPAGYQVQVAREDENLHTTADFTFESWPDEGLICTIRRYPFR